jgi:hypothetical protein
LTIQNGVTTIGGAAFEECTDLEDVYCYSENVPNTYSSTFSSSITNAILHVPSSSIAAYKATEPWSGFKNIVAIGDEPSGINDVRSKRPDVRGTYFDLNGRRLNGEPTQKGVYIQNGKKIIVK